MTPEIHELDAQAESKKVGIPEANGQLGDDYSENLVEIES